MHAAGLDVLSAVRLVQHWRWERRKIELIRVESELFAGAGFHDRGRDWRHRLGGAQLVQNIFHGRCGWKINVASKAAVFVFRISSKRVWRSQDSKEAILILALQLVEQRGLVVGLADPAGSPPRSSRLGSISSSISTRSSSFFKGFDKSSEAQVRKFLWLRNACVRHCSCGFLES